MIRTVKYRKFHSRYVLSSSLFTNDTKPLIEVNYLDGETFAIVSDMSIRADIYMHGPNKMPNELSKILNSELRQTLITLTFMPMLIQSTQSVKELFVFQRKCLFDDESPLELYPQMYTEDLCYVECYTKQFMKTCECAPFFLKKPGNKLI